MKDAMTLPCYCNQLSLYHYIKKSFLHLILCSKLPIHLKTNTCSIEQGLNGSSVSEVPDVIVGRYHSCKGNHSHHLP